jgi:hypothetical protein
MNNDFKDKQGMKMPDGQSLILTRIRLVFAIIKTDLYNVCALYCPNQCFLPEIFSGLRTYPIPQKYLAARFINPKV